MDTREAIFDFIIQYKFLHQGNTPTIHQIMDGCDLSTTSLVVFHLNKLADAGRITRDGREITVPGARWEYGRC